MDFLSIILEDVRGPRTTVFLLKIMHSKSAGNHGMLQAKSYTSNVLFSFLTRRNYYLGFKIVRKNTNQCLGGLRTEDQGVQSPQTLRKKHKDQSAFK